MSIIHTINKDVLSILLDTLDKEDSWKLGITCRSIYKILIKKQKIYCKRFTKEIVLKPIQGLVRSEFRKIEEGVMVVRARPSFGKTILGYSCLYSNLANYNHKRKIPELIGSGIIMVAHPYDKQWLAEAEKLGLYNANPELSKVLFAISSRKKHLNYTIKLNELPTNKILVVSKTYIHKVCILLSKIIKYNDCLLTLIIDEAHKNFENLYANIKQFFSFSCDQDFSTPIFNKLLMLSAEKADFNQGYISRGEYRSIAISQLSKIPELKWNFTKMEPNYQNLREILEYAIYKYKKVCVVGTFSELEIVSGYLKLHEHIKCFRQKTGALTTAKFNNYQLSNCVLLINTGQSLGINIHSKAMIIIHPGHYDIRTTSQTISRMMRSGNPYSFTKILMLYETKLEYHKSIYTKLFHSRDCFPFTVEYLPNIHYLSKSASLARCLGGNNLEAISQIDGMIIYNNWCEFYDCDVSNKVINWWLENKDKNSILTENIIRNIVYPIDCC
jgi:hypothetical protein